MNLSTVCPRPISPVQQPKLLITPRSKSDLDLSFNLPSIHLIQDQTLIQCLEMHRLLQVNLQYLINQQLKCLKLLIRPVFCIWLQTTTLPGALSESTIIVAASLADQFSNMNTPPVFHFVGSSRILDCCPNIGHGICGKFFDFMPNFAPSDSPSIQASGNTSGRMSAHPLQQRLAELIDLDSQTESQVFTENCQFTAVNAHNNFT